MTIQNLKTGFAAAFKKTVAIAMIFSAVSATTFSFSDLAHAQGSMSEKPPSGGPRRQLGTIIYSGLGGAVLGLSTLSFYGRPQDKLANIAIGFAVGVMIGTVAVTYNAATNPDEFYGSGLTPVDRDELLGPAIATSALASKNAEALSAPAFSTSYEVLRF